MSLFLTAILENNSTELIIWGICVGVILGFVGSFISKSIVGPFVRALIEKEATKEEKAITLSELGFSSKKLLKLALKEGSALRNIVTELPYFSNLGENTTPSEESRFYIPQDKLDKAKITYGKGEKWYLLLLFVVLCIGAAFLMSAVMPILVEALF